jgi:RimJ/RimL family protein N-acetyltransferase
MPVDWRQDESALAYLEALTGLPQNYVSGTATWLTSRDKLGNVLGVVLFSRFTEGGCEISVAASSPRFITKEFARAVAGYLFGQCNYRRVTAFIAVGNLKSLNLAQRLGFKVEGRVRSWFQSGDAYILGLTRDDCSPRFLRTNDGKVSQHPPTRSAAR